MSKLSDFLFKAKEFIYFIQIKQRSYQKYLNWPLLGRLKNDTRGSQEEIKVSVNHIEIYSLCYITQLILIRLLIVDDNSSRIFPMNSKCSHKRGTSNESSQPLLSSGSDGSNCDVCSEIITFSCANGDTDYSGDEVYSSNSTCCTTLHWSSSSSCTGTVPPYTSNSSLADDNESSSVSFCGLNNDSDNRHSIAGDGLDSDCNNLPKGTHDNRCSWTFTLCINCGQHYCGAINGSCNPGVTSSNRTISSSTISTIVSDHRTVSPASMRSCARHHHHHQHNGDNIHHQPTKAGILSDRASLCSQSSHSSSGTSSSSTGSYQSSSEYSVPRSSHQPPYLIDLLYDKPRNLQHAVISRDKRVSVSSLNERTPICSCHLRNGNNGRLRKSSTIISYSSEGQNNSPGSSPKKFNHLEENTICSFNNNSTNIQSMHYQIPRTALANLYLKVSSTVYSVFSIYAICGKLS